MKNYGHDTLSYIDCVNEYFGIFKGILNEVENEESHYYDETSIIIDAVREKLKEKENEIRKELAKELKSEIDYLNFQKTMHDFEHTLCKERTDYGIYPAFKTRL